MTTALITSRLVPLGALLASLAVTGAVATSTASASANLTADEAETFAIQAADRYTDRNFGIDDLSSWRARCRVYRRDSTGHPYFNCRLTFNGGQCSGTARVSGRTIRVFGIRLSCGE